MAKISMPVLISAATAAGDAILEVYNSDFAVYQKEDKSPLTLADSRSHQILSAILRKEYPYPVLSEEGKHIAYEERKCWEYYWLVDPLDGTKEFINRNGDFTVNIALIRQGRPLLGVIYVPVSGVLYYAQEGEGAFKLESGVTTRLRVSKRRDELVVVGSRSHSTPQLSEYVERVKDRYGEVRFTSRGSSLKFCLVAEGGADIYARLGPTMEWDTAAGQIIVEEAGGRVIESDSGFPMRYNKQELINPYFVASQQL